MELFPQMPDFLPDRGTAEGDAGGTGSTFDDWLVMGSWMYVTFPEHEVRDAHYDDAYS